MTEQTTAADVDGAMLMRAIKNATSAPYVDTLKRLSRLTDDAFDRAAKQLVDSGLVQRCSAPHGVLLYPTLRGAKIP